MTDTGLLQVLAFGAHPDDVEIFAGGIICSLTAQGRSVGIVDLTEGELGSRGSVDQRRREAAQAAEIMGVHSRTNLGLKDGAIENSTGTREHVIRVIRTCRPSVILIPAPECRHPDHPAAARLVAESVFYAGLRKIVIQNEAGEALEPHRPLHVLHYIQSLDLRADLLVDITDHWERKMRAVRAYGSQVHNPDYKASEDEPTTFVSDPDFLRWIESRAIAAGYRTGFRYAEGLIYRHGPLGSTDLLTTLGVS